MKKYIYWVEEYGVGKIILLSLFVLLIAMALQNVLTPYFFIKEIVYLAAPEYSAKGIAKSLIYVITYALSAGFLLFSIFQKSPVIFIVSVIYIFISYFVDVSSQLTGSNNGFTYFQYALFLNEANNYKNIVIFIRDIANGLLISVIAMFAIIGVRRHIKSKLPLRWGLIFLPFFFLPAILAKTAIHYISYASYPAPIKIPIIVADHHLNAVEQPVRALPDNVHVTRSGRQNIVLIADESVSGTHLSINGYEKKTTPFLEEIVKNGVARNFGIVNSTANCSALSQLSLRIGLSPETEGVKDNFANVRRTLPTIYQYAKRAGYKTWLFDAQVKEGTLTNHLTYEDLKYVDTYYTNNAKIEDYRRDETALRQMHQAINYSGNSQKNFIVFVKDGAHWPYLWRYPKSQEYYKPVQKSEYDPRTINYKDQLINTYDNVMRFTVNDFLQHYLDGLNRFDVLTFYTSDHGQAFFEPNSIDNLTHCSTYYDPPSSQVAVPLLILNKEGVKGYEVKSDGVYSQHQIFPSMLREMGYADDTTLKYGRDLSSSYDKDHQRFFFWSLEGNFSQFKN